MTYKMTHCDDYFSFVGSGWASTYHFLDPTTGVAAVFGTQLCGPFDAETFKLYNKFEEALYAGLEPS